MFDRNLSVSSVVATGLLLTSSIASAEPEDLKGFYAGISVGRSLVELDDEDSPADFKGKDVGYKLSLGYRFLSWFGAEMSYTDFGKTDDRVLAEKLTAEFDALSASAMFLWSLNNTFDLFARVGASAWDGKVRNRTFGGSASDDGVDPMIGLGAQYLIGRVAIRAEAESVLLGDEDNTWTDLYSIGVTMKF